MAYFAGLDVSVKETTVCVVDEAGKVICEQQVPSETDDIVTLLTSIGGDYGRVGIEAGPLSPRLVNGMTLHARLSAAFFQVRQCRLSAADDTVRHLTQTAIEKLSVPLWPGSAVGREQSERQVSGCDAGLWKGDKGSEAAIG